MTYLVWLAAVLALDQASKWLVLTNIQTYEKIPLIPRWLNLTLWHNSGGAFGILQDQGMWLASVAVLVSLGIVVLLVRYPRAHWVVNVGLACIAAGALGNLIDRMRLGHVVDFVQVCFDGLCAFPVFNVADSAIVVGTALILWSWLRQKKAPAAPLEDSVNEHTAG